MPRASMPWAQASRPLRLAVPTSNAAGDQARPAPAARLFAPAQG